MTPSSTAPSAAGNASNPLLQAPILRTLLRFAAPNMLAMLATALAAIGETAFVGSFGVASLAGMALVFPMIMLQGMLSAGAMGGGVSSAISRALGAGQLPRANALAVHASGIGLAAGALTMLAMLIWGPAIFVLLGGRGEALAQAIAYSNMAFCGSIGVWLLNTFASIVRGGGNMAIPSATLLTVSVAQVLLAGTFGLGWGPFPRMGMAGVAAGQVVAYSAGALFLGWFVLRGRAAVKLPWTSTPLQAGLLRDILRVGALACISPLQTVLCILILTRMVALFGTNALAGYGIGTRLEFLLVPITFAFGVASAPMVGMAVGAGRITRARRVAWTAAGMAGCGLGLLGLLLALAPGAWTGLFTQDPQVLASAALYFRWAGPCYGLFGVGLCLYFSSMGAGKVGWPVLAGTLRLVLVAAGGWMLAHNQTAPWTIFALVALAMAAYGIATVLGVWFSDWGVEKT